MPRIKYYDSESGEWKCADQASSSGSSQNADLSQNDPTQPDYIKNRTHWVEGEQTVIEWDGSTEGRESFIIDDTPHYKISDLVPEYSELQGGTLSYYSAGTVTEEALSNTDDYLWIGEGCYLVCGSIVVAQSTTISCYGYSATVPSVGVYTMCIPDVYYPTKLTYGSTIVHQLDEKFIPESIARTTSTLPMPATASVGQFIMVSAVDENGKVTATEAVDAPTLPNAEEVAF